LNLFAKQIGVWFLWLLAITIFPQKQLYSPRNENIKSLFLMKNTYNFQNFPQSKNYNASDLLDSVICIFQNDFKFKFTYYYNNNSSMNYFISAFWNNGVWINAEKLTDKYDSKGNLISVLWEVFNSSTNEWSQSGIDIFSYDSLGNRVCSLHQYFDGQEFTNSFQYKNYFEGRDLILSIQQKWITNSWINDLKIINSFTVDSLIASSTSQEWVNAQWINSRISIYEFDENKNMVTTLTKIWAVTQWIDLALGKFEYDANNNLILETWQKAGNNNWDNWFRVFYEYDNKNNLNHLFGEEWRNGQWLKDNEPLKVTNPDGILFGYEAKDVFLYYRDPLSVRNKTNNVSGFALSQNFPNPFNPTTTISYQLPKAGHVTLKIYDVLGNEVKTLVNEMKEMGKYTATFDASTLASGMYVYQIKANYFMATKKMLLLK